MNMPAMQASDLQTTANTSAAKYENGLRAFTFWIADTLYAIDIAKVLTISQEMDNIQSVPSDAKGLLGMVEFQNTAVPILDFANLLGFKSGVENNKELIDFLYDRERDQVEWLDSLEDSLLNGSPFTKARDPYKSAFGQWYYSFKSRDETLMEILNEFDSPHKEIHALADKLLSLKDNNQLDEAIKILHYEKNVTLKRLMKRFEQARDHLKESSRQVLLYITENGISPTVALCIDDINDVVDFKPEQFKPMDRINNILNGEAAKLVIAYLKQADEADCLLIEAENLVSIAKA